jgi:O-antigen ligase
VTALAVFVFLIISRIPDYFPSLRLALVGAAVTAGLAMFLPRPRPPRPMSTAEAGAVLGLFALSVATIPTSVWPGGSVDFVVNTYSRAVIFFVLVAYCVRSAAEAKRVVWGFLAALFTLGVGALITTSGGPAVLTETYDQNDIAFVMACGLPIAVTLFARGRGLERFAAGGVSAIAVVTVILTISRTGFISLLVIGAILYRRNRTRGLVLPLVLAAGLAVLFVAFGSEQYWDRIATLWGGAAPSATVTGYDAGGLTEARLTIWLEGLELMLSNPIAGVGAGAFPIAEGQSHGGRGIWLSAHNSFLQIGAELGLVGLAVFVWLIVRGVKNVRLVRERAEKAGWGDGAMLAEAVEVSFYAYALAGFTLSQAYSYVVYLLFGLAIALRQLCERREAVAAEGRAA